MQGQLLGKSGGATVHHLNMKDIRALPIPDLPTLEVQRALSGVVAAYNDLIETNRRRIALLEESARMLYREWFVDLRFPGYELVECVNGLPAGWRRDRLDAALFLQRGFDLPNQARQFGDVPIYASTGVTGYHDVARVSAPGVVTGRSGTLGVVHYAAQDFWPLNTALWIKEFRSVTPLIAYFMLSEMNLSQYNSGASVPSLDRKVAHSVEVLISPMEFMLQFDEFVRPLFEQIDSLRQTNESTIDARDALLPQLMSGELAV